MDQGSVGDYGPFRYRQFERVSEIPGIPATHTVPTLFPDQFLPGCELIPDPCRATQHSQIQLLLFVVPVSTGIRDQVLGGLNPLIAKQLRHDPF